jgi:glycosyltransferase involved in cell wall biosynthesis
MDTVKMLNLKDVEFTGPINVTDYLGKMDIFLLTSISEGQPLSILEAFAAKVPCVATNVGNCAGLIHGERDDFGEAGIVAPVMSISGLSDGILTLAKDEHLRKQMGMNGYRRAVEFYNDADCMETYRTLYRTLTEKR